MKKFIFLFLILSSWLPLSAKETVIPSQRHLDSLLANFFYIYQPETNDEKYKEFDRIIGMCGDSLTRQYMTMQIFDHYSNSNVMGEEEVAIKIYDSWIANGKVKARSEFEAMEKYIFTEFNRHSLIGMEAPLIELEKPNGGKLTIPEENKMAILFFYATDCAKCKLEWEFMPEVLKRIGVRVNFYAINCSTDKDVWYSYIENFKVDNKKISVKHLWDPGMKSEYQKLYGILATPRIFLVMKDGEIVGRRLELENLYDMFRYINVAYGK